MLQLIALLFNKNQQSKSANIALKRLNEIISQLPNISQAELELLQKDLVYCLYSKYGFNKKNVYFDVSGNKLTMHANMEDIIR
jgi:hypothetical protein